MKVICPRKDGTNRLIKVKRKTIEVWLILLFENNRKYHGMSCSKAALDALPENGYLSASDLGEGKVVYAASSDDETEDEEEAKAPPKQSARTRGGNKTKPKDGPDVVDEDGTASNPPLLFMPVTSDPELEQALQIEQQEQTQVTGLSLEIQSPHSEEELIRQKLNGVMHPKLTDNINEYKKEGHLGRGFVGVFWQNKGDPTNDEGKYLDVTLATGVKHVANQACARFLLPEDRFEGCGFGKLVYEYMMLGATNRR